MRPQLKKRKIFVRSRKCLFCDGKTEPDYKDSAVLLKLVNEGGGIQSGDKNSLCTKHQRRTAVAIKRARHLAMLPFVGGI